MFILYIFLIILYYFYIFNRNIVDASALRDIRDASAFENYTLPKLYIKQYYCIEAAVHQRIVRVRSSTDRRNREPPARVRRA
jgi:small subunit ribosomal protein S26e